MLARTNCAAVCLAAFIFQNYIRITRTRPALSGRISRKVAMEQHQHLGHVMYKTEEEQQSNTPVKRWRKSGTILSKFLCVRNVFIAGTTPNEHL